MFDRLIRGTVLENIFLGNRLFEYLVSLLVIIVGIIIIKIIKSISLRIIARYTKEKTEFYNMLEASFKKSIIPALYILIVYFAIELLRLDPKFEKVVNPIIVVITTYFAVRFLITLSKYLIVSALDKKDPSLTQTQAYRAAFPAIQIVLWTVGLVFVISNLGFNVTALITGLGIGGIAIALAAQAVFKDFFSYIAIVIDKPFEIGDSITVDNFNGTVEHIGIKTTRLRSLTGEQLVFSNSNLTDSRIRNYQKMQSRRIVFIISINYETPIEQIREIPGIIKGLIESYEDTVFDRSHFSSYGDSGLNFETVYYVSVSDYNRFMDIQQEINLNLYSIFAERGIGFAYPTRRLIVEEQKSV